MARVTHSAPRRLRHFGKQLMIAFGLLVFSFVAGLQYFVLTLPKADDRPPASDGIVVITGGQQRLGTGLALLKDGIAKKMLVSGVGRGVTKAILAQELELDRPSREALECCVELEFEAGDTRGNARAARKWAAENKLNSLLLVTANYHLPRATLIFQNQLDDIIIHVWPVSPNDFDPKTWWADPSILRLLGREFAKYLTEYVRHNG